MKFTGVHESRSTGLKVYCGKLLMPSTTGKRDPTSPLQSEEVKKARSWSEVLSAESSIPPVMESAMETVTEAVIDTLSAGAAISATMTTTSEPGVSIQTINLAPANIASIVEMVAAAMEPNLATIVASSVHKAMAALQADVTKLKKDNLELTQKNVSLTVRVTNLEHQVDDMEQYSRRNCMRISGVGGEHFDENTDQIVMQMATDLGANLSVTDIDRSHRIGKPKPGRPRQIIVKFTSYWARNEVFGKRKALKDTPGFKDIYFNEDLTAKRNQLLFEARQAVKKKLIQGAWSFDGRLFIRDNNELRRNLVDRGDIEQYIVKARYAAGQASQGPQVPPPPSANP